MLCLRCVLAPAVVASAFVLAGCAAGTGQPTVDVQSPEANKRMEAVVALTNRAGTGQDRDTVIALLVDRLDDEDEGVRFFAIVGLDRLTGQRLGYRYADPPDVRRRAVERWRAYIQRNASAAGLSDAGAGDQG